MNGFFKQLSIYGLLPVIGKSLGFFLIPLYTKVFSASEFGTLELFTTLVAFMFYFCNLEFYTSIGKFYFERQSLTEKAKLISTGLYMTLIAVFIVICALVFLESTLQVFYIKSSDYEDVYKLCLLWILIEALSTYLSVIPRYENRAKLFVGITSVSLFVRVGCTFLYVLYFDLGLLGVILGHITGALTALVLYLFFLQKYLKLTFAKKDAVDIASYALPIVPGVLIEGSWKMLSRALIVSFYSINTLGLFAFAFRLSSVIEMLNGAVRMAWNPLIFGHHGKIEFSQKVTKISKVMGVLVMAFAASVTFLAPELSTLVGGNEYQGAAVLIGFLLLSLIAETFKKLRGFEPLINGKTFWLSIVEIIGAIIGCSLLYILKDFSLYGIGIAFVVASGFKYFVLMFYTARKNHISFVSISEALLLITVLIAIGCVAMHFALSVRLSLLVLVLIYFSFVVFKVYGGPKAILKV